METTEDPAIQLEHEFIFRFVDNLAELLGSQCEIVVHDFTRGLDKTIVKIVNGRISGRKVGGCPSSLFFDIYDKIQTEKKDLPVYFNNTKRGHLLKSSTTFIHDRDGKIVGAVCINFDMTDLISSQNLIKKYIGYNPEEHRAEPGKKEHFLRDVHELMEYYLHIVEEETGKPASAMNKEDKMKALAFLDQKGVLEISKAGKRLCDFFHISKFTLYTYLNEIRGNADDAPEGRNP